MNIDFWGDGKAEMIYIQFPIGDAPLISMGAKIFTRESGAGRALARGSERVTRGRDSRETKPLVQVRKAQEEEKGGPGTLWRWEAAPGFGSERRMPAWVWLPGLGADAAWHLLRERPS